MDQEIKRQWAARLRSGDYRQTRGNLRDKRGHCCLGVLCDMHAEAMGLPWGDDADNERKTYLGAFGQLPAAVMAWSRIEHALGDPVSIKGKTTMLSSHNDSGEPFPVIADAIEAQL